MPELPARRESLAKLYDYLAEFIDDLGASQAADIVNVSPDTIRRRVRGTQPWYFEEVIDLARHELERGGLGDIAHTVSQLVTVSISKESRPLLLPSNLRAMLRLVGKITTEIADALDDGRVDKDEAKRLIELLTRLDQLTEGLRVDLRALLEHT